MTQVICTENVNWHIGYGPNKGGIVTVAGDHYLDSDYYVFEEYSPDDGYYKKYFSPVADISELTEILNAQPAEI